MDAIQERIGRVLTEGGFITPEQLEQVRKTAEATGKKITDVLQEWRSISRDVLVTVLSYQFKVPTVYLKNEEIDRELLNMFPDDFLREKEIFPVRFGPDKKLILAMENPFDLGTLSAVVEIVGEVKPVLAIDISIGEMLDAVCLK